MCWVFFCVNEKKELDNKSHQLMRCFLCYLEVIKVCNKITNGKKGLISYYKTNGITLLKNHVDACFKQKIWGKGEQFFERNCGKVQHAKKWPSTSSSSISNFFVAKSPFKIRWCWTTTICEGSTLLVVKNNFPI